MGRHGSMTVRRGRYICLIVSLVFFAVLSVGLAAALIAKHVTKSSGNDTLPTTTASSTTSPSKTTTRPDPENATISTTTDIGTTSKSTTTNRPDPDSPWYFNRLPASVIPKEYNLLVKASPDDIAFSGQQVMTLDVKNSTRYILFHCKEMNIDSVSLRQSGVGGSSPSNVDLKPGFHYKENEYYVVQSAAALNTGEYELTVNFSANVSKTLTGFYLSTYKDDKSKNRKLLTTKFQPTDARKAFPCLDEPGLKATFNITVQHPSDYMAISNMPVVLSKTEGSWSTTVFEKSVPMSTYLVCYVISAFDFVETTFKDKPFRIYFNPALKGQADFALDAGVRIMDAIEKTLNVTYPLPKLDMVAIPDYASGATEHWGIITYRQARLLLDNSTASLGEKQATASIVSHEIAHFWFGNLVTNAWWNDLWLQEGFASYMEYVLMNRAYPQWNILDDMPNDDLIPGLDLDALSTSHPISQTVTNPSQIKELFDDITYKKGSSLLSMLHSYLGDDKFFYAVSRFLSLYAYQGATTSQLWSVMTVVDPGIDSMMPTWTAQMGFPLITVTRLTNSKWNISQQYYLTASGGKPSAESPYQYSWIVPFTYISDGDVVKSIRLNTTSATIEDGSASFIKGNARHTGFYRMNYDKDTWSKLFQLLKSNNSQLSVRDRASLLDDAFVLAADGLLDYNQVLEGISYLRKESSSVVWSSVLKRLNSLDQLLNLNTGYSQFRQFMRCIIPNVDDVLLGSSSEDFRRMFVASACKYGVSSTIDLATNLVIEDVTNPDGKRIPPALRSSVYRCGGSAVNESTWWIIFNKFMAETDPNEKSRLMYTLASTRQPYLLREYLRFTLNNSIIKSQDAVYVIANIAENNPVGKVIAWEFVKENYLEIVDIMKANNFHLSRLTEAVTKFSSALYLQEVEDLFRRYPDALSAARAREQALERIRAAIDWNRRYSSSVISWLNANPKLC